MRPQLVCHRGASLIAPENTFAAADAALDRGAHLIELDVRESADGVLYVLHDQTLDRTTDGTGPVQYRSAAEIDALDAGRWFGPEFEGSRVPRLDAYLDHLRSRGAGAYVEIKWCDADACAAILRETGMMEASFTFSFKPEMRAAMRAAAPNLRQMITLSLARNVSVARSLFGADLIEIEASECQPAVIEAARGKGLEIMGYTESDD
ncbi:MAG: glycerophosphodiester phosphodiesterase family protein, partial [Pseudomonadota bacterium]